MAAVTFGAVARNKNQNFTVGEGVNFDGTRARSNEQLEALQQYSEVLLDYCHGSDPICAIGSDPYNVTRHLDYFLEHNEEVTKWIVGKAQGKAVSVPNQGQSGAASTSVRPAQAGAPTPTSLSSASATGPAAEASQTSSSASNQGSTGAGSTLSAGGIVASCMVVIWTTFLSAVLL